MSFYNPRLRVKLLCDPIIPPEWAVVLTPNERLTWQALARVAEGDMTSNLLKDVARKNGLTPHMFEQCLASLRTYGCISFADDD